jgi:hypothetical protein
VNGKIKVGTLENFHPSENEHKKIDVGPEWCFMKSAKEEWSCLRKVPNAAERSVR